MDKRQLIRQAQIAFEKKQQEERAKEATIEKWQRHWQTRLSDWLRNIADEIELPYPFPGRC